MRVIPPSDQFQPGQPFKSNRRVPKRILQERLARQAAIERAYCRYLKLICSHYQTLEEDERVSHWRPKKGVTWCDNCHDWVEIKIPDRADHTPDQPLF